MRAFGLLCVCLASFGGAGGLCGPVGALGGMGPPRPLFVVGFVPALFVAVARPAFFVAGLCLASSPQRSWRLRPFPVLVWPRPRGGALPGRSLVRFSRLGALSGFPVMLQVGASWILVSCIIVCLR